MAALFHFQEITMPTTRLGLGFTRARAAASVFTPQKISNLAAWYDGRDAATQFSDAAGTVPATASVACWKDKSGGGNHLTQATAANQPVCTETLNGNRAIAFDGTNDRLSNTTTMANITNGDYTIFVAGQKRVTGNAGYLFYFNHATAPACLMTDFSDTFLQVKAGTSGAYGFNYISDTAPHIYVLRKSGSTALGWSDSLCGFETTAANIVNTGFYLGSESTGSASLNNMRYGEVLIYNRALTPQEEKQVRDYLRKKWSYEDLRIVAKGGFTPSDVAYPAGYTRSERRSRLILGKQPVEYIRLQYANRAISDAEKSGANAITVEAGLEYAGQTVMATFGGASTKAIAAGSWTLSDPIYPSSFGLSNFPANWDAFVRTGCVVSSGQTWPFADSQFEVISGTYGVVSNAGTSQISLTGPLTVPSGGATGAGPSNGCFGPSAILGKWLGAADISVLAIGDSIVSGVGDSQDNGTSGGGFITRGLRSVAGRSVPFVKCSKPGERVEKFWSVWDAGIYRRFMMQYATHLIEEFGTNDIYANASPAAIVDWKKRIWAVFKTVGKGPARVVNVPIMPLTTSTDAWATLANQSPAAKYGIGEQRDIVNSGMLALVGQAAGPHETLDVNAAIEDQTSKAKWRVNGVANAPTSDGIHPAQTGSGWAGAVVTSAAQGWSSN